MTNNRETLMPSASATCLAGAARCFIAALLVLYSTPAQAQTDDAVLRPWNCLMASSATKSGIGTLVTPAGCVMPAVTWSGPSRATAIMAPGAPSGLTATVTDHTVVLKWASAAIGGTPTTYVVQAGSASGSANLVNADTDSTLATLTATNVPSGTYFFRVVSRNASGTSAASNEIAVRVGAATRVRASGVGSNANCAVPPASTALTAIQDGNKSVTFTWRAGEGDCQAVALPDYYLLDYGVGPGRTDGSLQVPNQPTSVTVSLVGVGAGTYYVRVRGVNANGAGLSSNEVIVRVGGVCNRPPTMPTNLSGTVAGGTVVLAWEDSSPFSDTPTSYRVEAGLEPGRAITFFGVSGNVFRINGVPGGTYYFWVYGTNSCGMSAASAPVRVTVGGGAVPVVVTGVHQFAGAPHDGANFSTLIHGRDGNFYGTTASGGPINSRCVANLEGCGTIFRMAPSGAITILYAFGVNGSSPVYPYSRLLQAADGSFWGTTTGQEDGRGAASVFQVVGGSTSFISELGGPSYGELVQGPDGNIYGTTIDNGPGACSWRSTTCTTSAGSGTVFKITGGSVSYIHTFNGANGSKPYGGLVNGGDGSLYGTTRTGGGHGFGTIYKITPGGSLTTLYSFRGGADGAYPAYSALIRASDGNFYGTTQHGGGAANSGTVFKMTPAGAVTILHGFTGVITRTGEALPTTAMDGLQPGGGLLEGPDGNLYGVAGGGGGFGGGTAFVVTKAGAYTQLYAFDGSSQGGSPTSTLVLGSDGNLWGTAQYGGFYNRGTVFKMTIPR
jgi:uncharacterized repeat protein (TIGR03803 family)